MPLTTRNLDDFKETANVEKNHKKLKPQLSKKALHKPSHAFSNFEKQLEIKIKEKKDLEERLTRMIIFDKPQ